MIMNSKVISLKPVANKNPFILRRLPKTYTLKKLTLKKTIFICAESCNIMESTTPEINMKSREWQTLTFG